MKISWIKLFTVTILSQFSLTESTWLFEEAKHCNPSSGGLIPFSGFKIQREFQFQGYLPIPVHYLLLIHCDHGKIDYQTIQKTLTTTVDWGYPFCMLKPRLGKLLPLPASDTVNKIVRRAETVAENFNTEFFNQIRKGGIIILVRPTNDNHRRDTDTPLSSIKNLLQNKIDTKLEKLTKGRNIQYTGKRLVQHQNDIKYSSPKDVLEWESRDLICYKMARRKKYAKSNLSFYMPDTFIGGLFECPISTELKQKIIGNLSNHQILQPLEFQFECDASTARPILPLIADTSINQWIDFKLNPIKPTLFQTIPYLTTASPLNLRFKSSITADMHVDSWASQIHVNEIYDYTIQDVHCISRAIARTADYVNKLLSIDLSKIPLEYGHARSHDHEDSTIPKKSLLLKVESIVGLEEKLYTFIGLLPKNIFEGMMMKMQYLWDDIK